MTHDLIWQFLVAPLLLVVIGASATSIVCLILVHIGETIEKFVRANHS
jgi:hypothetical protein